jgi:hypothetical protein
MAVKFVVVHRADQNNVGDMASNPLMYFLEPDEYQTIDVLDLKRESFNNDLPLIVGGGGLLGNEFFTEHVRSVLQSNDKNQLLNFFNDHQWQTSTPSNRDIHSKFLEDMQELVSATLKKIKERSGPRMIWGAGHNGEYNKKLKDLSYPEWLPLFDKIGVRDYAQGYKWQPCASCMHPALRKKYTIKNRVIWFEHKKQLIKDFGSESIPRFVNSGNNIDQTIELLGTAETILTNSYHGAFWGVLLKKKVIVVNPWSSKFMFMKHRPHIIENTINWEDRIDEVPIYDSALDECIEVTEKFWEEVKQLK